MNDKSFEGNFNLLFNLFVYIINHGLNNTQSLWAKCGPPSHSLWPAGA